MGRLKWVKEKVKASRSRDHGRPHLGWIPSMNDANRWRGEDHEPGTKDINVSCTVRRVKPAEHIGL